MPHLAIFFLLPRYQRQIASDIQRHGEHYRALGRRVALAAPADMAAVLELVDEIESDLAEKLADSDERAVLKELGWPFPRSVNVQPVL